MERKSNRAGRFILCSVVGIGLKSFSIVISEGRGFPEGWVSMATMLQALGVISSEDECLKGLSPVKGKEKMKVMERGFVKPLSFVEAAIKTIPRSLGKSVSLQLGEKTLLQS